MGGDDSLYVQGGDKEFVARKKAILAETRVRLDKLPAYIEKKKWSEVTTELSRYMYETRGAIRGLSTSFEQKQAAEGLFKAIEDIKISATFKKGDACLAAAQDSVAKLDKFVSLILKYLLLSKRVMHA